MPHRNLKRAIKMGEEEWSEYTIQFARDVCSQWWRGEMTVGEWVTILELFDRANVGIGARVARTESPPDDVDSTLVSEEHAVVLLAP